MGSVGRLGEVRVEDMGECISYFEWSPLPYYNIYIYSLWHRKRAENAFSQYFSLGSVKKLTKIQGFHRKVCIIHIMNAFWIRIRQLRIPPSPGLLAIVRKFAWDGGYFQTIRIYEFQEGGIAVSPRTISLSHPPSHLLIYYYILLYIIFIYIHLPLLSPTQHSPLLSISLHYISLTLLKFKFNFIYSPLHYYNLYHSPQFLLYLSLHF